MDIKDLKINGKILIFTDLHLGLSNNKESRMKIAVLAIKEILEYVKKNNIKTIFFLGDWNHSRVTTENQILNISYKLMSALQKQCSVYCLIGNHDIYLKNSLDINSLIIFKDLPNVHIIDSLTKININSQNGLLVPWLSDLSKYKKEEFDLMFGHFEVSSKFLIKQYIEDNMMKQGSMNLQTSNDLVGDFVDYVKKDGIIFSGHIHGRKEFISKGRNFIFVGSPYQQNLGEINNLCGFYILDENNKYKFYEIKSTPKHINIVISQIIDNIENFDFSIVKGNIIHKIYDLEIDNETDLKISQKISDFKPYEELLPEYNVKIKSSLSDDIIAQQTIELLKKSKLEYIQNYIENIDSNALQEDNIDKEKLFKILEKYYNDII